MSEGTRSETIVLDDLPETIEVTLIREDWDKAKEAVGPGPSGAEYPRSCALAQTLNRELDEGRVFRVRWDRVDIYASEEAYRGRFSGKEAPPTSYRHNGTRIVAAFDSSAYGDGAPAGADEGIRVKLAKMV